MSSDKYGFVYLWYDRKHKRYYVGCRWGHVDDGYVCSSPWMKRSFGHRPNDFKRRILVTNIPSRAETYTEEQRWLDMIKPEEIKPNSQAPRYYNLKTKQNKLWHYYDDNIKTIGQKISEAKKAKNLKFGPMSEERKRKISEAKKKGFAERGGISEEHRNNIIKSMKTRDYHHTEQWKQQNSIRLKQQWSDGTRKRKQPKQTMTRREQDALCSQQLKERWADPVWAAQQREKLKRGWIKRRSA